MQPSATYLPCVEIAPQHRDADAAIIWLHGLGANGHDFEPIVPELRLPASIAARFIFPHAPEIPVTVNGGMRMPAWYDIKAMDLDRVVDEAQLLDSASKTVALIEREIARGIDSSRIIVAGFSQGGAVAYHAALTCDKPLGGLLALSTYFATPDTTRLNAANRSLPVQICHGSADPMVPEQLGQRAVAQLQGMGLSPAYLTYPMGHEVCLPEISDIAAFFTRCLS
ncbi:MAG: alpha/beta fold hydrolase [Alcanivorax sp.]|nr:alpha/beta fold hydrolase [Alcanivorax sp.]